MARTAFGELISVNADVARYRFADDPGVGWDGEVVIFADDPDQSFVVGRSDVPFAAGMVVARAYRRRETDGVWPGSVTFLS